MKAHGIRLGAPLLAGLLAIAGCSDGDSPSGIGQVAFVEGAVQTAEAGLPLPVDPGLQVLDRDGRPMPNIPVTFVAEGGNEASVFPGFAVTGEDGIARTRFTLGTIPGPYALRAVISGQPDVVLAVTAVPSTVTAIQKSEGDEQVGAPGAVLPVSPRFRAMNALGNGAAGAPVTCTVEGGGGSVAAASVVGDGTGFASCGPWTLGPERGAENVLRVAAGSAVERFRAAAGVQGAVLSVALGFQPSDPTPGYDFQASVSNTYVLQSVTLVVRVDTAASLVVAVPMVDGKASIAADRLPRGRALARATAVDVLGNEADGFMWFDADPPPVVGVEKPLAGSLARPTVRVLASCLDDGSTACASLVVRASAVEDDSGGIVVASGSAVARRGYTVTIVDADVDLSAFEGRSCFLTFTGEDGAGHRTRVSRRVYVDSSPALALVGAVGGEVLDVDGTRILHQERSDGLAVTDLATAAVTRIGTTGTDPRPSRGFLTPVGAVYVDEAQGPLGGILAQPSLMEWRGAGAAQVISRSGRVLFRAGDFVLYERAEAGVTSLVRRDAAAGADTVVAAAGSRYEGLASNGDVVFVGTDGEVHRFREGTDSLLTSAGADFMMSWPLTDGSRVAYAKRPAAGGDPVLAVWDGAEHVVGPLPLNCSGSDCYLVSGPWLAFLRPDPALALVNHVWRLGPEGAAQLTFFASGAALEALEPDGTVVYRAAGRRWLTPPAGPATEVGTDLGRVVSRDGRLLVLLGRNVLQVTR